MRAIQKICAAAALALVAALLAANLYRAWTQSITADEAFTYNLFLDGAPAKLFNSYDAAHHVFHTLLCKVFISLFGLSEFTLRIPSLLGGLLYLATAYRLSRNLFGRGFLLLLSVALLTLNPFVLDHLSAARGYGLAAGLFLWALYHASRYTAESHLPGQPVDVRPIRKVAFGLALSVASNLTLLLPAAGLTAVFLSLLLLDGYRRRDRSFFAAAVDSLVVPSTVTAFVIVILPLLKARMDHFYVGAPELGETVRSLIGPSLFHHEISWLGPYHPKLVSWTITILEKALVPAVLLLAAVAFASVLVRWLRAKDFSELKALDQFLYLTGGSILIALGLAVAAHRARGVLYPVARTGLYLIPLFVLAALALWKRVEDRRWLSLTILPPLLTVALLCVGQFTLQFQANHYGQWRYDAGTRAIVSHIRRLHRDRPDKPVRLGISWLLEPSINFYRKMYRLDWMAPVTRDGPKGRYDFYVLLPPETSLIKEMGLSVLHRDPLSEAVLAAP